MKKVKYLWLLVLALVFVAIACSNDSDSNTEPEIEETFDVRGQLEYIFDDGIRPQIALVKANANNFKLLTESYNEAPTEDNFEKLKDQWKELMLAWKPMEMITIGDFALTSKVVAVHFWPLDVGLLEENIVNFTGENSRISATAKGLGAIEYMLFSKDYESFITDENNINTSAYLNLLIDDVISVVNAYEIAWLDYEVEFKTSIETGVTGTQNQILNKVVFTFFDIIVDKIQGTIISNTEGSNPLSSEAPYSELSLEIINTQIEFVNQLFSGSFNGQDISVDVMDQLGNVGRQDLSEALENKFEEINLNISLTNNSLEILVKDKSETLNQIEESIVELHTLIGNDVFSALGIVTTVGDNDGDS